MKTGLLSILLSLVILMPLPAVRAEDQASSWEKPAHDPAPAAPNPAQVLASGELPTGETVEITELKRTSGDTVTLKLYLHNNSANETYMGVFGGENYSWNLSKIYMLDIPNKKKYFVLKDTENVPLTSKGAHGVRAGSRAALWAKFPAPPMTVSKITIEVPGAPPFDDLPISPQG